MTTAAHTPGPWEIHGDDVGADRVPFVEVTAGVAYTGGFAQIAQVHAKDLEKISPQDRANAALIAAAPEMYRALQAAHHALRSYEHGNASPHLAMDIAAHAEKVLAKARGEPAQATDGEAK